MIKETLKNILKLSPIPFSKNHRYDILTRRILKQHLSANSNCIDIGCHKGEILDLILKNAPNGQHIGVEPIPYLFENLEGKYKDNKNCAIYDYALSNKKGVSTFNLVVSNPAYSGLIKRDYDKPDEIDETIEVKTELLDHVLPEGLQIDLIKIDVEGAELLVLEGARKTIQKYKPLVIFEHGLGASEHYNSTPELIYKYFQDAGMNISTLTNFIKNRKEMSLLEFEKQYYDKINYYFIAHA